MKQNTMEKLSKQANRVYFPFFLNLPRIFSKGTSRNQFFSLFFYIFLWARITKDVSTKIGTYNWGGMWSTEIHQVLWIACKTLNNFFFIFLIFLAILMRPNRVRSKWCQESAIKISDFSDKRAKSYANFTKGVSSYVFRKAQHGDDGS